MDKLRIGESTIVLVQGDITKQEVDAVINAANSSLMGGGGVDGAIHRAGGPEILEECKRIVAKIGRLPAGRAVITTGGELPAKYVIHTVGPVWSGGDRNEAETLASAYTSSLRIACDRSLRSLAFPSISTGAYRYPLEEASAVALGAVAAFVRDNDCPLEARFVLFDKRTYAAYERALAALGK
ncbi:MAG: O-acetyl-ADP-ribose deacetylase [Candidatus Aquicultorales bacterium]